MFFIYLISDENRFKIGSTKNLPERKATYKTHNPKAVWVASVSVPSRRYETLLRKKIKEQGFLNVENSIDWFYGHFSEQQFQEILFSLQDFPKEPSLDEIVSENILLFLEYQNIPIRHLFFSWKEEQNIEWLEFITIEETEKGVFQLKDFVSKMLFLIFHDYEKSLGFYLRHKEIEGWEAYEEISGSVLLEA